MRRAAFMYSMLIVFFTMILFGILFPACGGVRFEMPGATITDKEMKVRTDNCSTGCTDYYVTFESGEGKFTLEVSKSTYTMAHVGSKVDVVYSGIYAHITPVKGMNE